ncbi:MAG: hypothetical protein BWX86_02482 [Verrucomicrobia bacterium ADurb.Bin122]|nr:MAG: hypothetical protein BWX86_02482 [Verrucomicrobia bacterium ADurb.Bin122]
MSPSPMPKSPLNKNQPVPACANPLPAVCA